MKFLNINKNNKGFSLIEMIVAVGLFTVAITISLGALLNINDLGRRAEAIRTVNDNVNFSLEAMMREIRAGSNYVSYSQTNMFTLTNNLGQTITYRLNINKIERSVNGAAYSALTSSDINITNLIFVVHGQVAGDNLQPVVTISINGFSGWEKERTKSILRLQTTISQRKLDS
jgi:prepilin-type N-terminal cleavage/methylation domain-containing protein